MKIFIKYISHLRKQNENVKIIHAVIFSSILTGIFSGVYLYFVRGINPTENYITKEEILYKSEK